MAGKQARCTQALNQLKALLTDYKTFAPFCHGTKRRFARRIAEDGEIRPRQCSKSGVCRPSNYDATPKWISLDDRVYFGNNEASICYQSASGDNVGDYKGVMLYVDEFPDKSRLEPDEDFYYYEDVYWKKRIYRLKDWAWLAQKILKLPKEKGVDKDWIEWAASERTQKLKEKFSQVAQTPSFPKKVTDVVFDAVMNCSPKRFGDFLDTLPEWAKSLLTINTVAYRGAVPIDKDKMFEVEKGWDIKLGERFRP